MNQELKFNGYTAQPSDYECQDGDLAAVLNLMPEKGALRPVCKPKLEKTLPSDTSNVLFIHTVSDGQRNIITRAGDDDFYWQNIDSSTRYMLWGCGGYECYQVNAIGNTLIILGENGIDYFTWQKDSQTYLHLGNGLPETVLSFGLQGKVVESEDYYAGRLTLNTPQHLIGDIHEDNIDQITGAVLAKINKFIADEGTNAGKFIMPFFVRYAYRLYDGSLTRQSAPILMMAASDTTPIAAVAGYTYNGSAYTEIGFQIFGVVHQLDYAIRSLSQFNELQNWKDIIRSIDIFISAPIYKYDINGKCKEIESFRESDWYCICKHSEQHSSVDLATRYQKNTLYRLREHQIYGVHHQSYTQRVVLPQISEEAFNGRIKDCSAFYLLKSIPISELSVSRTVIDIANDYLPSLVTRENLSDDYDSHDKLIPKYAFNYNARINVTNLSKELFKGFEPLCLFNYTDGFVSERTSQTPYEHDTLESLRCLVTIKQDGRDVVVESVVGSIAENAPILYFFYPNANARKVLFIRANKKYEIALETHPFLNGAFFFSEWNDLSETSSVEIPSVSASKKIEIRNKIYTSEINNPFLFPLLGINTVGSGQIIGISTAAKALSQGQFGQFPLYAFSDDGVWALEVSSTTGAFSAKQPITRDVCINPDSITQIDSAVLFATDRGIMLISGSQTQCITDVVDNDDEVFQFSNFPFATNIKTLLGITPSTSDELTEKKFSLFLEGCQMLYAYNRQAIILFSPMYSGYAYIYSLESKQWSKIPGGIESRVPSYPEAYAYLASSHRLVDYSNDEYSLSPSKPVVYPNQFLLTRPLKLDPSLKDVHKTIENVIARGRFDKGHVKVILYGSRDLEHWFPIATSVDHYLRGFRGTPYKYFRIALVCSLTHDESVWGCSIQYTPRLTNQPR